MPLESFDTAVATRPSEVTGWTFDDCVAPPSTACWKNVYEPALELRPTGSIVVVRFEPPTWLQFVATPVKMFLVSATVSPLRPFDGLTATHRPSRNSLKYVVSESLGSGGRVLTANSRRPACASCTRRCRRRAGS